MVLKLLPVEEGDFLELITVQIKAFAAAGGMAKSMSPNPLPPGYAQKAADKHQKSWREEPDITYLKVIDTDLDNKIVAAAKWRINENERTEEQIKIQLPVPGIDEEGRLAAQDFMWYLNRVRREYMGTKPFYFLHLLATDPEHHRRGAGAMLLDWGCSKADKAKLPTMLESTQMGRPLYMKFGFVPKHEEIFDLTKYGQEGTDTNTVMIREPVL